MKIKRADLTNCPQCAGSVIVIDVLRAFTTSAVALALGVPNIILVGELGDAFKTKEKFPEAKLIGEVDGVMPEGFDYGNSPSELMEKPPGPCLSIHRTTSGTQGVVRSVMADEILATSFVNAKATAQYLLSTGKDEITLVVTGSRPEAIADEDEACADYIELLLRGQNPDYQVFINRVRNSSWGKHSRQANDSRYSSADLEIAASINLYDFIMPVLKQEGLYIMRKAVIF